LFCIVHCLSASDTDEDDPAAFPDPDGGGDELVQAAANPRNARTMNSPENLFI
jgi:hypothetical protein